MNYIIHTNQFNYENVLQYIKSNFYQFNYINNFNSPLGNKKLNNDIGWSCTIKSFQMLLSKIISVMSIDKNNQDIVDLIYKEEGLLSIHNFIKLLNQKNLEEGKYLGSYLISNLYQQIINNSTLNFKLSVTQDNIIDIRLLDLHKSNILLFSTKLGLDSFQKDYKQLIYNCFLCNQFLGFIGGVGKSCYYFFGFQEHSENLLYLDPHIVTEYNNDIKTDEELLTNHYSVVYIDHLNPSITFCFYYKDYKGFLTLKKFLEKKTIFNILNKDDFYKINKSNQSNSNLTKNKHNSNDDWEIL